MKHLCQRGERYDSKIVPNYGAEHVLKRSGQYYELSLRLANQDNEEEDLHMGWKLNSKGYGRGKT